MTAFAPIKKNLLYQRLKQEIAGGHYAADGRLPPEVELATRLGVARDTLRPALARLARENILVRVKGRGTFVNPEPGGCGKILAIVDDNPGRENPYHYIMPGVQSAATAQGIPLETCTRLALGAAGAGAGARLVGERRVRGVLLMLSYFLGNEPILDVLRAAGLPVVIPHGRITDFDATGFTTLAVDFREALRLGLRHLADAGHRRVAALFSNAPDQSLRGLSEPEYADLLAAHGQEYRHEWIIRAPYATEPIERGIDALLALRPRPTALFCYSDFFALIAYPALARRGVRIPEDLAVLAIGGHSGCDYLNPGLSAVDLGYFRIGETALALLKAMVAARHNGEAAADRLVRSEIRMALRGSTAPAVPCRESEEECACAAIGETREKFS